MDLYLRNDNGGRRLFARWQYAYTIEVGNAFSSDTDYNGLNPTDVSYTNVDDDTAGITIGAGSIMITTEGGGTNPFTVVLNSQPTGDVEICLDSSDVSEGTINIAGTVTAGDGSCSSADAEINFSTSNWNVAQTVTVTGADDALVDGEVLYTIDVGDTYSTDSNYDGLGVTNLNYKTLDND